MPGMGQSRYRVFFVLPDQTEGQCELGGDAPISPANIDAIERDLMARIGSTNALVIGWQEIEARPAPSGSAGGPGRSVRAARAPLVPAADERA